MDLLKKVIDSFSREVYIDRPDHKLGPVFTINIYGFGIEGSSDEYIGVGTKKGEEMFRTLLKRLYKEVLHKDPEWHYFFENTHNHLRFSLAFYEEIKEVLDLHEANYSELTVWIDGHTITRKYQHIFQKMFHSFSLLAVQGYDEDEIEALLDRVIHCFINHQYTFLPKLRKSLGSMMEPELISRNAYKRAEYIGYILSVDRVKAAYSSELKKTYSEYAECVKKQRESGIELMEILADMEPGEARESLEYFKAALAGEVDIEEEDEHDD